MCTVTFIPKSEQKFILTSNRDEAPERNTLPPRRYHEGGVSMLFPKDVLAGGTWIGLSDHKRLICLLNGGFNAHTRKDQYRMSRGLIVTTLLVVTDALKAIREFDFDDIEPFTLLLADWSDGVRIFELVWDGHSSHFNEKPIKPLIWSSSLLYTDHVKREREHWFQEFIKAHPNPDATNLLNFHKMAGGPDPEQRLIMDRGFVRTKSITQITNEPVVKMRYEDLQTGQVVTESLTV